MIRIYYFAVATLLAFGGWLIAQPKNDPSKSADDFEMAKTVSYYPADWNKIRLHGQVPNLAEVDGYLDFEPSGEPPQIKLWETEEACKQKRYFHSIGVQVESASKLLVRKLGDGGVNWRVLQGAYVRIEGTLELEDSMANYRQLGRLKSIVKIKVYNNGSEVLSLD